MKTFFVTGLFILISFSIQAQDEKEYLKTIVNNLEKIQSASYYTKSASSAPGDRAMLTSYERYIKEYANPADTIVYSSFISADPSDTTKPLSVYDGIISADFSYEEKTVFINDFKGYPSGMPRVMAPFISYTKAILKYASETDDHISMEIKEYKDSSRITLKIYDKVLEFSGKPLYYNSDKKGKVSRYDIWIDTQINLPYKVKRDMHHQVSFRSISQLKTSDLPVKFKASQVFPRNFTIENKRNQEITTYEMEGKKAPDWKLQTVDGKEIALAELKEKVLLVRFTGVGCGPCHASIPFLKELVNENQNNDFKLVSIESYSNKVKALRSYRDKNEMNYPFLVGNKELTKSYKIIGVPVFFLLDEDRVIQKVFFGYMKGKTDKKIRRAVKRML